MPGGTAITTLHNCCHSTADVTTEEAIFGCEATGGHGLAACMLSDSCEEADIRFILTDNRRFIAQSGLLNSFAVPADLLLAIRLYTYESETMKFFTAINKPFYDPGRTIETLQNQLPYVRLLIRALRSLGAAAGFHHGVVYRGVGVVAGSYLQEVYDNFVAQNERNGLRPGGLLRFPSFTSTSLDDSIAKDKFKGDMVYVMTLKHDVGVKVKEIACVGREEEVLLIPPISFVITSVEMVKGNLYIYLDSEASDFSYLRAPKPATTASAASAAAAI